MKFLVFFFCISWAFIARPSSLVLEAGKESYELGSYLDLLEDPTTKLTLDDVKGPLWKDKFKRNKVRVPNFGYLDSAYWIRFDVKVPDKSWVLKVAPNYHDNLFFYFLKDGKYQVIKMGDRNPGQKKYIHNEDHILNLDPSWGKTIYIRVFSLAGVGELDLKIMTLREYTQKRTELNYFYGMFLGAILAVALYNLFLFFRLQSLNYLLYVFYVLGIFILISILQGFGRHYFFSHNIWMVNEGLNFLIGFLNIILGIFTIRYLKLKKWSKFFYYLMIFEIFLGFCIIFSVFTLPIILSAKIMTSINTVTPLMAYASSIYVMKKGYRPARYYFYAFSFSFLGMFTYALYNLGVLPGIFFTRNSVAIGNIFEILLLSMGLADRFNYSLEKRIKKEKELSLDIEMQSFQLEEENRIAGIMYEKLQTLNLKLEDRVKEATEDLRSALDKTEGMLSNINKAIFSVNPKGVVLAPVSSYTNTLFKKDIVGTNGLNLLFFHFQEGSALKKDLIESFSGIFGNRKEEFESLSTGLPSQVIQPDSEKPKGRILDIQYVPLFSKDSKIEKLMFIVEDVTEIMQEHDLNREVRSNYHALREVLTFDDKDILGESLSQFLEKTTSFLITFLGPDGEELKKKALCEMILSFVNEVKESDAFKLVEVKLVILDIQTEINREKEEEESHFLILMIEKLSGLFLVLIKYLDGLNKLKKVGVGSGVRFELSSGFHESIVEKKEDLGRMMTNLLEYVFLVRTIDDLDEEKIENAPKKARLYSQFDDIILKIMYRTRLISFLLNIVGNSDEAKNYLEFSDLLKQMPSKDKLTQAALMNHLIRPYRFLLS